MLLDLFGQRLVWECVHCISSVRSARLWQAQMEAETGCGTARARCERKNPRIHLAAHKFCCEHKVQVYKQRTFGDDDEDEDEDEDERH